jgi:hypothetical protein
LYHIAKFESEARGACLRIPDLDCEIAGGTRKDVLGGRVEEDLSNFSNETLAVANLGAHMYLLVVSSELAHRFDVHDVFGGIRIEGEALRDFPKKYLLD